MDVTLFDNKSVRIKGKQATFIAGVPQAAAKLAADGILLLQNTATIHMPSSGTEQEYKLLVQAPGEYEIAGVKLTAIGAGNEIGYLLRLDGMVVCIVQAGSSMKLAEQMQDCDVGIILADQQIQDSFITTMSPRVVIVFGEKATEAAKVLGKESTVPVKKAQTSLDKLPAEMEVVVLQ